MRLSPEMTAKVLALAGEAPPRKRRRYTTVPKVPPTAAGTLERVTLPLPPSTNEIWGVCNGRMVKTRKYRAWIAATLPAARLLRPPPCYPCTFLFCLKGKVHHARDGDNVIKSLLDLTVRAGVIPGDSLTHVRSWFGFAELGETEPEVVIWFEELEFPTEATDDAQESQSPRPVPSL